VISAKVKETNPGELIVTSTDNNGRGVFLENQ
jgi:hypothetical protein